MARTSKTPPETIAKVRRLWAEGATRKQIAAITGVNPPMISHFCQGIKRPPLAKSKTSPETIAEVRRLWAEGKKRKEIVALTGVSPSMVSHFCKNIPRPLRERKPGAGRSGSRIIIDGLTPEDIKVMPYEYVVFHQIWKQAQRDADKGDHDAASYLALLNDIYDEWLRTPRPIRNPGWKHRLRHPVFMV